MPQLSKARHFLKSPKQLWQLQSQASYYQVELAKLELGIKILSPKQGNILQSLNLKNLNVGLLIFQAVSQTEAIFQSQILDVWFENLLKK